MKSALLAGLAALVVACCGIAVLERPVWLPVLGREDPVRVLLVGSRHGVGLLKGAVDPARIVSASADAVVLEEGRVIAASAEAASAQLVAAGWVGRRIEIVSIGRADRGAAIPDSQHRTLDEAQLRHIAELMQKPSLTRGEALLVMKAMRDGGM